MNLPRASVGLVVLLVWLLGQPVFGEGWALGQGASKSGSEKSASVHRVSNEPSLLERMNTGTKEFFGRVGNVFSPPKPKPTRPPNPFVRSAKKEKKKSIFSSWFAPKEPEPPRSLREWMELEPIRP